ncbi:unnamed protein product, partial [Polarella glacialis]
QAGGPAGDGEKPKLTRSKAAAVIHLMQSGAELPHESYGRETAKGKAPAFAPGTLLPPPAGAKGGGKGGFLFNGMGKS